MSDKLKAYLAFTSVSFFWGTTYLAIRIGVEVMPPALFAGVRFFIAGIVLGIVLLFRGDKLPPREELLPLSIIGFALLTLANGTVVRAEQYVPSGLMALIVATLPFSMVTLETLSPKGERLTLKRVLGLLVGFLGLLILLWPDLHLLEDGTYLQGIILALLAPIFWSAGSIYAKGRKLKTSLFMGAAVQMTVAGAILSLFGLATGEAAHFNYSTQGAAAMAYLVVFGSIVGYGSYIYALDKLPPTIVSMYAYINPVVAVLLGWLILKERFDIWMAIATTVILAGVVLVKSSSKEPASTEDSPSQADKIRSEESRFLAVNE